MIDKAAIFSTVLQKNALRREAHLPVLDVRATFEREVEQTLWREHVQQHHADVRAQVFHELRQRLGREPLSTGGRWALNARVHKALVASFRARHPI